MQTCITICEKYHHKLQGYPEEDLQISD